MVILQQNIIVLIFQIKIPTKINAKYLIWKRYIDDKLIIIDIYKDIINNSLLFGKFITITKRTVSSIYPSNIKLKPTVKSSLTFLDVSLSINPNSTISTKIYEKPMNKHMALHWNSNNPINHKESVFQSQLF